MDRIQLGPTESIILGNNEVLVDVEIAGDRRPALLDALRRLCRCAWTAIAAVACPECYLGGGWESGACEGCRAKESCRETVLLP